MIRSTPCQAFAYSSKSNLAVRGDHSVEGLVNDEIAGLLTEAPHNTQASRQPFGRRVGATC